MRQLILVHGRAQENKDGAALKKDWIAAWEKGLAKSNLKNPLSDQDIHFPYYGDTLIQMVGGKTAAEAAEVVIKGAKPGTSAEEAIIREMITEIAMHERISKSHLPPPRGPPVVRGGQ